METSIEKRQLIEIEKLLKFKLSEKKVFNNLKEEHDHLGNVKIMVQGIADDTSLFTNCIEFVIKEFIVVNSEEIKFTEEIQKILLNVQNKINQI